MKFIEYCDAHKILLAIFSPHSIYTLQPLDVSLFSLLARAYSDEIEKFLHDCQRFYKLSKRDFFRMFWVAWHKAITEKNILSGWKKVSLIPWEPENVLK